MKKANEKIEARVKAEIALLPEYATPEGVQVLNAGRFMIETLRAHRRAKERSVVRATLRSE